MEYTNYHTVLKRLEAATSRLEDIVLFNEAKLAENAETPQNTKGSAPPAHSNNASPRASVPNQVPSLTIDSVSDTNKSPAASKPAPSAAPAVNKGIEALKGIADKELVEYVKVSHEVAEPVAKQAEQFKLAFLEMLKVVELAQTTKKPESMDALVAILTPMSTAVAKIEDMRNEFRSARDLNNFLATVPAGAGALGWVSIEGKNEASGFVKEMRDSALFYGNRALKDREGAKKWLDSFMAVLNALSNAVKDHYASGIEWGTGEAPAAPANSSAPSAPSAPAAPSAPSGGAPPPPPPPPSVAQLTANLDDKPAPASGSGGGLSGVFAELSQGESIASTLKPVDKAALKSQKPPVPKSSKPGLSGKPGKPGKPAASGAKKQPRLELVESTWHVEDLDDKHDIEIAASMGQSVRIDNCNNCTIKVTGKAATFNLSRCNRVGLLVETMVASCDIVNCTNFGLQVTGTVPSLMIDQSAQGSIYLSEESLGIDIFTSQTTAININIPEGEPGAYREVPLGEQILHNIVNGGIKSQVVKHA